MTPPTSGIRRWQRRMPLRLGVVLAYLLGPFFPTNILVGASAFLGSGPGFLVVNVPPPPTPFILRWPSSHHPQHGRTCATVREFATPPLHSFLHQRAGESDAAHLLRIQALASDPVAFERAALAGDDNSDAAKPNNVPSTTQGDAAPPSPSRGGYQRVEDWDREQREKDKNGDLSWEERVQFDGLRHGNRAQQNEILKHHLKVY